MEKKFGYNNTDSLIADNKLSAVIKSMELDKKRVAQGLHDDIASKLNVISLNCHLLKIPDLSKSDIEEITKNIIEYTAKALESTKKMTNSLLPPVLDKFGLHAGIEELCSQFIDRGVNVEFVNRLDFDFKENHRHVHVFRILHELLTNSVQHGNATEISIVFDEIDGKNSCKYSDNGIGFDLNELENQEGLGMRNILGRIDVLEGNFSIESKVNNGVLVVFNF